MSVYALWITVLVLVAVIGVLLFLLRRSDQRTKFAEMRVIAERNLRLMEWEGLLRDLEKDPSLPSLNVARQIQYRLKVCNDMGLNKYLRTQMRKRGRHDDVVAQLENSEMIEGELCKQLQLLFESNGVTH